MSEILSPDGYEAGSNPTSLEEQLQRLNTCLEVLLARMGVRDIDAEVRNIAYERDVRAHPDKYPNVCTTCYSDYNGCVCGAG